MLQVGEGLEASYFELKKTADFFEYKKGAPANLYGGALLSVGIPKGRLKCQLRVKTLCGGNLSTCATALFSFRHSVAMESRAKSSMLHTYEHVCILCVCVHICIYIYIYIYICIDAVHNNVCMACLGDHSSAGLLVGVARADVPLNTHWMDNSACAGQVLQCAPCQIHADRACDSCEVVFSLLCFVGGREPCDKFHTDTSKRGVTGVVLPNSRRWFFRRTYGGADGGAWRREVCLSVCLSVYASYIVQWIPGARVCRLSDAVCGIESIPKPQEMNGINTRMSFIHRTQTPSLTKRQCASQTAGGHAGRVFQADQRVTAVERQHDALERAARRHWGLAAPSRQPLARQSRHGTCVRCRVCCHASAAHFGV
jgi:hypothetical protein